MKHSVVIVYPESFNVRQVGPHSISIDVGAGGPPTFTNEWMVMAERLVGPAKFDALVDELSDLCFVQIIQHSAHGHIERLAQNGGNET